MNNQAQGLQQMSEQSPVNVIAITSGKGGVGKTNIAVNLAVGLAKRGKGVVVFDADLGLANVDIALGLRPKYDIRHVISGERTLEEVLLDGPEGIRIVPASSGVSQLTNLSTSEHSGLIAAFSELTHPVDTLIVDTGAGIDPSVLTFSSACQSIIVVICDEPTSITDAYALIKVLNKECGVKHFQLLANKVDNDTQGRLLYGKLSSVAERFLDVSLGYLGAIPRDGYLRRAVQQQCAVVNVYPNSRSAQALLKLADQMNKGNSPQHSAGGLGFFFERLMHFGMTEVEA